MLIIVWFSGLQVCSSYFSGDNCLWRLVVYTEHDFHFIMGFKLSSQTLVFTLNPDSRKGYLHRQWLSSLIWFHETVINTEHYSIPRHKLKYANWHIENINCGTLMYQLMFWHTLMNKRYISPNIGLCHT